jgi:hypothetical protein
VTGGKDGNRVWLDIGRNGRTHVMGTLQHGQIVGTAFDDNVRDQYQFVATLSR